MSVLMMERSAKGSKHHPEEKGDHSCMRGFSDMSDMFNVSGGYNILDGDDKYIPDGLNLHFPGPLMSNKMQKDKLIRFIQGKVQDCLLHLDEPQQQYSYFFWQIMERICNRSGRVTMAEVAPVLFNGYSLLRRTASKLGRVKNWENWCIPLARLLCSAAPEDELRKAVVQMGDDFASRGWIYAAHICYVLACMELGLRNQFQLIGCDGFNAPDRKSDTREAIERTEVYEYVLFLTSGSGQLAFQEFKFLHAYMLASAGLQVQALDYCENIAEMVIRFPRCVCVGMMEVTIELCETLLQEKKEERPEWLLQFHQLLILRLDLSSPNSLEDSDLEFHPSQHDEFDSRYTMGEMLGKGGFGSVYAGVRKADGKKVAIKCVPKALLTEFITIPGETHKLPLEMGLMEMVSRPCCDNVVELLEWFETAIFFIMVLERPDPCMDLHQFRKLNNRRLPESVAREVMRQVIRAARHCIDLGVLHCDIKATNILINPDTLEVKLIDFGCGDLLTDEPYTGYAGTPGYWPPEWVLDRKYFGVPATIWSLGVVMFDLVCGNLPFVSDEEIIKGLLKFAPDVSPELRGLITWCLDNTPEWRPTFDEILRHNWFKKGCEDTVRETVQTPHVDIWTNSS